MKNENIKNPKGAGRKPKLTPIEKIVVLRMYEENKPIAEIAYLNKISPSTVSRIVKKLKEGDVSNE